MNEEIKALQEQLAEVKRQKEELHERMQAEATLNAVNKILIAFYENKIKVFYDYLNDIQNSKATIDQTNLIYHLFSVLDVNVVLD